MTRTELEAAIASKFEYSAQPREVSDGEETGVGLHHYAMTVWDTEADRIEKREVHYMANADGSVAWWIGGEPKPATTVSFYNQVIAYLDAQGAVTSYVIDKVDEANARVRALISGAERIGYIYYNAQNELTHTIVA